jgi:hypothetical protein
MSNEDPTADPSNAAAPAAPAPAPAPAPSLDAAIAAVKQYLSTHSAEGMTEAARRTRMLVYELVQAQEPGSGGEGAIYKDLKCGICTELVGTTPNPATPDPVTLTCGHMYCRGCVNDPRILVCPACRVPIAVPVARLGKSAAVAEIVSRLLPRPAAGGAGGGGPRRSYRKSRRSSLRSSLRSSRRNRRRV